jgi:hypothetical protein
MAIFYTDTGSFNQIEVTGSTILSGSLIVSGTTNFGPSGLTGSLFGTASYANLVQQLSLEQINGAIGGEEITPFTVTATEISASFVKVVAPAPNFVAMITTGSHEITGSIFATTVVANQLTGSFTGSFTGPLIGSASWASSSISSSFATTASFARSSSFAPTILPSGLISSSTQFNTFTTPFTGSFTGSFSGSSDRFSPAALRITVGTTAPSSPAVNDLWVDTN